MKNISTSTIHGVEPGGTFPKVDADEGYRLFRLGAVSWDDYAAAHVKKPRKSTKKKANR